MDEAVIENLHERIHAMSEADRVALDPICEVLQVYNRRARAGVRVLPNRVVALACADILKAYQDIVLSRP